MTALRARDFCAKAVASGLFLSYLPYRFLGQSRLSGSGLIGTLWAVLLLPVLPRQPVQESAVLMAVLFLSVVIADVAEQAIGHHDDPRIVVDEFIGYWMAVAFLPRTPLVLLAAFVLFRYLDVTKPSIIHRAAELPGGWGVVMDDVLAGVCSNLLLHIAQLVHSF
jgi:phosphatidylglycerophosphatase A